MQGKMWNVPLFPLLESVLTMLCKAMDEKDRRIVEALLDDARASLADLASDVGLTGPSISERIKRLERKGIIRNFTVELDPKSLGYALQAIVRIRPMPGKVSFVEKLIAETAQIVECDKVTGDDCFVARLNVRSIEEIDSILERISDKASTSTSIVKRKVVERRMPPLS